jgi:hypothetical protein
MIFCNKWSSLKGDVTKNLVAVGIRNAKNNKINVEKRKHMDCTMSRLGTTYISLMGFIKRRKLLD